MKIKEGEELDEYIIIRSDEFNPALNIVTFYGENESRTSQEEMYSRWQRLVKDLKKIELRNEHIIIASDINRKLGNDHLGIKGNGPEVSFGGSLVRELVASGKYFFANNTNAVSGGPFTRIDPSDNSKKSVLDVIILSTSLLKHLDKLVIDENYDYPMQYPKKVDGKIVMQRSDHLTLVLRLKNIPMARSKPKKTVEEPRWNYGRKGGWEVFKTLTEEESNNLAINSHTNVDQLAQKFETKLTKIKHKAFGKCSDGRKKISSKVSNLMESKQKTKSEDLKEKLDEEIGKELIKEKYESVEKQIETIKMKSSNHQAQVFQLRKIITNNKDNSPIEAIIDPDTKETLFEKDEILEKTLQYASGVLQNNHPVDKFKEEFEEMKIRHGIRMDTKEEEDDSLTEEDFFKEIKALKGKGKNKYKEITEAGKGFQRNVFEFMKYVWESEKIPARWNLTPLVQIFKSGNRNALESYRYVHIKDWMPRVFDGIVFSKMKQCLVSNMSKFQIGAKPGHRAQEHIFVLNSVIELYKKNNVPLIVQTWDISRYFDRHSLLEAQEWLADCSVPGKCYRLVWEMNRNMTVQVKTAAGVSRTAVTGENLGQGSKSAGMICSTSLSKSTSRYYADSPHEVSYGSVMMAPMLYQDDSLCLTTTTEGARDGCRRFENIMDSKALEVNTIKSAYLIIGKKKNVEKIRSEIAENPLYYKDSIIKEKSTEKWLGSIINSSGNKESTISTINERKFRIMNMINETIAIIEDCRLNRLGGLKCSKEIWELAIIPALLNNSEIFSIQDKNVQKTLEDFQSTLWRGLLAVPKSCPLPSLTYESNSILMKFRVYSRILNFRETCSQSKR